MNWTPFTPQPEATALRYHKRTQPASDSLSTDHKRLSSREAAATLWNFTEDCCRRKDRPKKHSIQTIRYDTYAINSLNQDFNRFKAFFAERLLKRGVCLKTDFMLNHRVTALNYLLKLSVTI